MGWSSCGTDSRGRPIGYGHRATCDHDGCKAKIDRGLGYACGGMHGTSPGCEGYFCGGHLTHRYIPDEQDGRQVCLKCAAEYDDLKVEAFREELTALANTATSNEVRQKAYDVLLEWDETDDLVPDLRFMRPDQYEMLRQRAETRATYKAMAASAAGEGATT